MGHVVPGLLLFGLSLLWLIELVRRRLASRSAAGARRAGRGGPHARPALHVPRASFTTLECLGKLLFPAIGIGTEIRSAARKQLPTGILPAFSDHAGRVLCEAGGDRECREYTTTLQHWFHITIHLGFMCAAIVEMLEARRAPGRPAAAAEDAAGDPEDGGASLDSLDVGLADHSDDERDAEEDSRGPQGAALFALAAAVLQMSLLFGFHSSMHKHVKGDAIEARAHELLCFPLNVCARALALFCEALAALAAGRAPRCRLLFNACADWLLFFRGYGMCVAGLWLLLIPLNLQFSALLFDTASATVMFLDMELFWFFMAAAVAGALGAYALESACFVSAAAVPARAARRGLDDAKARMRIGRRASLKLDRNKSY